MTLDKKSHSDDDKYAAKVSDAVFLIIYILFLAALTGIGRLLYDYLIKYVAGG